MNIIPTLKYVQVLQLGIKEVAKKKYTFNVIQ